MQRNRCLNGIRFSVAALIIATICIPGISFGQPFTFTKVVDSADPIPGTATPFGTVGFPKIDGSNVLFSSANGLFSNNGTTNVTVVQKNSSLPGAAQPLGFLNGFSQDGGASVFNALSSSGAFLGVYRFQGGMMTPLALPEAQIPDTINTGNGPLAWVLIPSADNGAFAFNGAVTGGGQGIYTNVTGALRAAVDHFTAVPGTPGAVFSSFGPPVLRNGKFAFGSPQFTAAGANTLVPGAGIYAADPTANSIRRIADLTTPRPGGGTFTSFDANVAFDGSNVAFLENGASPGVYAEIDGALKVVADTNTLIPGTDAHFSFFDNIATDGGRVIFGGAGTGTSPIPLAIYGWEHGTLTRILGRGDLLDGQTVKGLEFGTESFQGDRLAVGVGSAIYVATVPEPALGLLSVPAMIALSMMRRPRR